MITLQKAIKADQCMGFLLINSVYSLVITAVSLKCGSNGVVQFLGRDFNNSSLLSYSLHSLF
jgi:hypothetical protein